MDIVFMLVVFGGGSVLLAWVTMRVLRKAAEKRDEIVDGVRPAEARTGRCGVCGGLGTNIEMRASSKSASEVLATCWRCGGSGVPPG